MFVSVDEGKMFMNFGSVCRLNTKGPRVKPWEIAPHVQQIQLCVICIEIAKVFCLLDSKNHLGHR